MKLKVHMSPVGSGLTVDDTIDLYCGDGEQILQWVGYTVCARLAYKRGEVHGRYVPQSVTNKDGQPQDIDIVINEIFGDGDEVYVEYSSGPMPYRVRWEGRPRTPPFKWGEDGEVLPPHDTWLHELDLKAEGLGALVDPDLVRADPSILDKDLAKTKEQLVQYAGALQMMFYNQSAEGASSGEQLGQITLPQFRGIMTSAKVVTPRFPPEKMDEIFTSVATSPQTLARKVDNKSGVSTFDLLDFMVGVIHVAYHRFAAEHPSQAYQQLSYKVMRLFKECFAMHTFPDLAKKLSKFEPATQNPAAALLLKRGRKLVEQTLDSCQLKRVRSSTVKVDLRWLCTHLQRWSLLGRDFNLQELAVIATFAKQTTSDPEHFALHPQPLEYNYNDFERLLLGIAWHIYVTKKKGEAFEEFLGETLDGIFKKAGVLVEVAKDKQDGEV
mmetsp:Transcript_22905/g.58437  ORF Transcript_22905/g.58437 Transcript_22905/m.58437 type:complete len:440 (-) Transcript_22905:427-1746(-)|eukprot:CAMPEP_0202872728 /NCGR_PEP_ID=MMETSP1391-20130828/21863_1 /ASSEMBLY_ACC=CAM_ASM_000867 /TAXON_ID=1034604 /ORGANISM="Chlamydomonas leiostraca, Strain SAG 11-49" /LENGTH=439 /DNA_ID=CAMNT_0049553843 /DNA_START=86 /DNA_END=1405 /DNA_ORIENTATION=-